MFSSEAFMISSDSALLSGGVRRAVFAALAVTMAFSAGACSTFGGKDDEVVVYSDDPPDKLYNEGLFNLNSNKYDKAASKFQELDKQHPYTEAGRKGALLEVYSQYKQGNYDEAATAAKRYVALHPTSPDAAYAQFLLGMSYYNKIPDVTRDQTRTQQALNALEEVPRKWPNSEYAEPARQRIQLARDQLAGKEMEIGRYYLKERNYIGAINRFKTVVTTHQTTRHVEEALARLAEAYMSMGIVGEAQTAAAVLGHNFPQSPWYKDTYTLMSTKGLTPREDKGSWISKAFG
jgi:outer membrane protein assembly factor BamD